MKSPYLDWILSNTRLFDYHEDIKYNFNDIVTIGIRVFKSLCNDNQGNYPPSSPKWIEL